MPDEFSKVKLPGLGPGTVALVTGATGAIGRSTTRALLQMGCSVGAMARSRQRLADLREEIGGAPSDLLAVPGDVARTEDARHAVEAVLDRWDRIDVLVHLAAVNDGGCTLTQATGDVIDRMLAIDVRGSILMAQAAAEPMIARGRGRIVNVASIGARVASPQGTVYGVTKAALVRLSRQLAVELGPHGITANTVSPATPRQRCFASTILREQGARPRQEAWRGSRSAAGASSSTMCIPSSSSPPTWRATRRAPILQSTVGWVAAR